MNTCPETWNAELTALALEALQHSGRLRLQLRGASMLPTLWPGDEVEIASCSPDEVKRGDVVLAFRDARFVLHRVIRSSETKVSTRGDAMARCDSENGADAIVGKVVRVTRGGRTFPVSSRFGSIRRAVGILFCYSGLARRIALRLHSAEMARNQSPEPEDTTSDSNRLDLCNLTSDLCNSGSR